MTDPTHHDAKEFRYLVHMVNPLMAKPKGGLDLEAVRQHLESPHGKAVSLSLVDADHRATFGGAGFIVRVPAKNVEETSTVDLQRQGRKTAPRVTPKFYTPSELLESTGPMKYNEVTAKHRTAAGKLEVVGLLRVGRPVSPKFESLDDRALEASFAKLADKTGLPVVHIDDPAPKFDLPWPPKR